MSKDEGFRGGSGRTQALDLDDVDAMNKRKRAAANEPEDWVAGNSGWDDPWQKGPKQRSWAQDERWTGDDGSHRVFGADNGSSTMALDLAELKPRTGDGAMPDASDAEMWAASGGAMPDDAPRNAPRGWSAPKRDEMVASGAGWDDWNEGSEGVGQSTMALSMDSIEEEAKEQGGRRKRQAAASYQADSSSVYGDGQARRRDIYRSKEDAEAESRGRQAYGGGRREVYGAQQNFDNDDWSSSADAGRRPSAPPAGGGAPETLPPSERTVALDLDGGGFGGGGGAQTLPPNERTVALDGFDASAGGFGGAQAGASVGVGSLVIFSAENPPVPYELGPGVTSVGRGLDNDVVLSDPFASRKHFLIVQRDGHFEVRDSGTDNGTCVNGQRVTQALLRPGDHIELGNTVLRFVPGTPGPGDMMFGPPPPIPPHHLAPPPDGGMMPMPGMPGSMAHPMPGMMPPGMQPPMQPRKSRTGLVLGLILVLLVVLGGGAAAAYFLVFKGSTSSSSSSDDEATTAEKKKDGPKTSTQAGINDTGYVEAAGPGKKEQQIEEAMAAHDDAAAEAETKGEAGTTSASPATAKSDGPAAVPAAATAGADPVLVAGLVGSTAMATGQARPLKMTLSGEPVEIKIDSDPTDAEIFDQHGSLIGRTPYHITQIKADLKTKWTVKKPGFDDQTIDIDFTDGTTESLSLAKDRPRTSSRRKKEPKDEKPRTTAIPTVD